METYRNVIKVSVLLLNTHVCVPLYTEDQQCGNLRNTNNTNDNIILFKSKYTNKMKAY